jgi:hypothetical protein
MQIVKLVLGCAFLNCSKQWTHRVCFLWVTAPNSVPLLGYVSSESLPVFLPWIELPTIQSAPTYMWALFSISLQNTTNNNGFLDWAWWWWLPRSSTVEPARSRVQHKFNFSVLNKRDFKSIRDVRKYAPKQTVNWPRFAHGEFCVMQVYQGWDNSGRRFWHCSRAWVGKTPWPLSFIIS